MKDNLFETIKVYLDKEISPHEFINSLIKIGYKREEEISIEGDFSLKGEILEIFPVNFYTLVRLEWEWDRIKKIYSFDKELGRKLVDFAFLIILPVKRPVIYSNENYPLEVTLRIKEGDYVVHTQYGIGKFLKISKVKIKDKWEKCFEVLYANGDKLYIPFEELHHFQKYTAFSLRPPKLTNLRTNEWKRIKDRVSSQIKNFAWELINVQAKRMVQGGIKFSSDTEWQKIFEEKFIYPETEEQIKSIQEVKKDMESDKCMDRIICGDVGYGKTEVAMRAAFKALMDGYQVVFLVPTTILAYQHYLNFKRRVGDFPVNVEMLSRFRSLSQQKDIIKGLKDGRIDIIVGTHRLLSSDVQFKRLGLLIIDEEHKFGVEHKERIKKLMFGVDILTLSATPIPRTLYMSMVGLKDISIIRTPPKERIAIKTKIVEFDCEVLRDIILKEIDRGGQVFFITNKIKTLQRVEKMMRKYLPERVKWAVVHGRLPEEFMEDAIKKFLDRELNLLFSTGIVESGIDVPYANTIIIYEAEKFGLADLHQLRGRVGRLNVQAFAYFVVDRWEKLSTQAKERLQLIVEYSHLGAGFEVAMKDLELRGAGNILGKEQHGFVNMVGLDLYCRLLKKEIEYIKKEWQDVE